MGIVLKQTFKGSFYSYLGVIIGGINVAILFPILFSEAQIGLINILITVSAISAQFASLGSTGIINYFFPKFRDKKTAHNGFFVFILLFASVGFLLFTIIFFFWGNLFLSTKVADTSLQDQYYLLIYPLTFFTLAFSILDIFCSSTFNSVIGALYKDVILRIVILVLCILYYFGLLQFNGFILLYTLNMAVPVVGVLVYLIRRGDISYKLPEKYIYKPHFLKICSVGFFNIINGFSNILATYIDKIMISFFIGLGATGIYSITSYIGALARIPYSSMNKIGIPIIAKLINENNHKELSKLLKKSSLSQILIGMFIFIVIWVNIDLILSVFPVSYSQGKWVVFFISISHLIYCFQGFSSIIIQTSRYYKYATYFTISLGIFVVLLNYYLIPIWGINGAAVSTVISRAIYVIMTLVFLHSKMKIQVFFKDSFKILVSGVVAFLAVSCLPNFHIIANDVVNTIGLIIIRSVLISILFITLLIITRFIKDIRNYKNYL